MVYSDNMNEYETCEANNKKNLNEKIDKISKKFRKMKMGTTTKSNSKKNLLTENPISATDNVDTGKSEAELRKIAKKKAKKLAQKLKKKENRKKAKAINITDNETGENNEQKCKLDNEDKLQKVNNIPPSTVTEDIEPNISKQAKKKVKSSNKAKETSKDKNQSGHNTFKQRHLATIFVGNLPVNTKRVQLLRLFKDIGTIVSIRLRTAAGKPIFKSQIKKNAGSLNAYVVFENKETAESALKLNGIEFKSNHLRITPADKTTLKNKSIEDVKRTVFVGNLKYSATEESLREVFSSCGEIDYIRCLRNGENQCNGVAYVCFKRPDAVGLALELNETILEERPIHVERYTLKKQGAKKARDATNTNTNEIKSKEHIKGKNSRKQLDKINNKIKQSNVNLTKETDKQKSHKSKKSEYKGVKVDPMKSKLKLKKKKKMANSELNKMIKKIAPKAKV